MKHKRPASFALSWYTIPLRMIVDITDPVQVPGGISELETWLNAATGQEPAVWVCITRGPFQLTGGHANLPFIRRAMSGFTEATGLYLPARFERQITPGQRQRLFLANLPDVLEKFSAWGNVELWRY